MLKYQRLLNHKGMDGWSVYPAFLYIPYPAGYQAQ